MGKHQIYPLQGGYSKYLGKNVANPIIPCKDARFCQGINRDRELELVDGNSFTPLLLWLDLETGEEFLVPNIWYNQSVAWRIRSMEFNAERARERARQIRKDKTHSWWRTDEQDAINQSKGLLSLAEAMRRTGKVLA